jgi:hypothetical protein
MGPMPGIVAKRWLTGLLLCQAISFNRGRSFQTAKGPERSFGRLRGLASPSELCGSGGIAAKWVTSSGQDGQRKAPPKRGQVGMFAILAVVG